MITEQAYQEAAKLLNTTVDTIKTITLVESNGSGFLSTGQPTILFEPHKFWNNLIKKGINPRLYTKGNEDILYPKWGTKPYGKISQQPDRLERAAKIDRYSALMSASYGTFQILGENYKLAGFSVLQDFINAMYKNEDEHLKAFCNFIINRGLSDELRNHNWEAFAKGYNGSGQVAKYGKALKDAYNKLSK